MTALEPCVAHILISDVAISGHLSWQCIIYSLNVSADEAVVHERCALDALAVPTSNAGMRPRPRCRGNDRLNVPRSHLSRCSVLPIQNCSNIVHSNLGVSCNATHSDTLSFTNVQELL